MESVMSGGEAGVILTQTRQQGNGFMAWRRPKLENEPQIAGRFDLSLITIETKELSIENLSTEDEKQTRERETISSDM